MQERDKQKVASARMSTWERRHKKVFGAEAVLPLTAEKMMLTVKKLREKQVPLGVRQPADGEAAPREQVRLEPQASAGIPRRMARILTMPWPQQTGAELQA